MRKLENLNPRVRGFRLPVDEPKRDSPTGN
jgi:hypothetical protein